MDLIQQRSIDIRTDVNARLEALEHLFTQELAAKLQECHQSFAAEKTRYIHEIDTLKESATRIGELEEENSRLSSELKLRNQKCQQIISGLGSENGDGSNSRPIDSAENETVDIKKYNRLKEKLAENSRDYGRVVFARQVLESKVRHYKDMTKQWREYTDRWILSYPKKQPRIFDPSKSSPDATARDPRSSSAPAPPSIPDGMTSSLSDWSRPASPWAAASDLQLQHGDSDRHQTKSPKLLPDRIIATQKAPKQESLLCSKDPTETLDESLQRVSKSSMTHNIESDPQKSSNHRNEDEESPVFISERCVNRKRHTHIHVHEDSRNPSCIKGEQKSSSPLPTPASIIAHDPHESLDLDDNGAHVDTPRKRQKLEHIRLIPTTVPTEVNMPKEEVLVGNIRESQGRDFPGKDEDDQNPRTRLLSPSCFTPEGRRNDAEHDGEDQTRRLRRASSRAQQQLHNKRVQARLKATVQSPLDDVLSKQIHGGEHPREDILAPYHLLDLDSHRSSKIAGPERHSLQGYHKRGHEETTQAIPLVLQPTDSNANILPRTNEDRANKRQIQAKRRQNRGAAYVLALAEDGESSPSKHQEPGLSPDKPWKASDAHQRLGTLLSGPSPVKSVLESNLANGHALPTSMAPIRPLSRSNHLKEAKASTTPPSEPARKHVAETEQENKIDSRQYKSGEKLTKPGNQSLHLGKKGPVEKSNVHKARSENSPAETRPEHEPLRARPILRLGIDDFKLNPAHSEYAYHESIRKHDEKKAISGCTDRNCLRCKDIRKFVESSGYAQIPGQNSEEADRRLVKDYLGLEGGRWEKMSAEEKKELSMQARMQQFADKFGKHRTPFGRAVSPVDFWNTDFPTTQEHERNREAARQREREKVEQMYYEAIKKGGRYVFADE